MNTELQRLNQVIDLLKSEGIIHKQSDIAAHLGYSRQGTISEIVNGKKPITSKFLKAFCMYYGLNESYIRHGKGKPFKEEPSGQTITSTDKGIFTDYKKWVIKQISQIDELERRRDEPVEEMSPVIIPPEQVKNMKEEEKREKADLINEIMNLRQLRDLLTDKVSLLETTVTRLLDENNRLRNSED